MKYILFILIVSMGIAACNSRQTSTSSDSTNTLKSDSITKYLSHYDAINDTTILPDECYESIARALAKCDLSKTEMKCLKLAIQRSKRFDQIHKDANIYYKALIESNKQAIQKFKDTAKKQIFDTSDNSYAASLYRFQSVEEGNALQYLRSFRHELSVINASMRNSNKFFSLQIGNGDNNPNNDFSEFIKLLANGTIDGIRIYVARYTNNTSDNNSRAHTRNYTLIVVGTKNGIDYVDLNYPGQQIAIQNYGQPCRPNCGVSPNRLDRLGEAAGE